jgi:hypothetical protein
LWPAEKKYEVLEYALIEQVKVGTNEYKALTNIKGNNFDFLEQISTTVIGQIGFVFF